LPQAADIGLHVVLARGATGSGRVAMDPMMRRLQELNTPDIMLSCPPSEGAMLMGTGIKPRQFPPGRGMLVTRRSNFVLQTAYLGDDE